MVGLMRILLGVAMGMNAMLLMLHFHGERRNPAWLVSLQFFAVGLCVFTAWNLPEAG